MDQLHHATFAHLKAPPPCLGGVAGQGQAVMARQLAGVLGGAVLLQVLGRGHAQAPVVSEAHADHGRVRHVAHPHGTVKAFARHIHHPVAEVQRNGDFRMQLPKTRHQRRHMATAKPGRCGDAQMPTGLDAPGRHTGLGIGHIGQHPLAVLQERTALVRQGDAPRGAHQQLHAQARLQRIQAPPHDGRGHALCHRSRRQTASGGDGNK